MEALLAGEEVLKQGGEVEGVIGPTEITPGTCGSIMEVVSAHSIQRMIKSQLGVAAEIARMYDHRLSPEKTSRMLDGSRILRTHVRHLVKSRTFVRLSTERYIRRHAQMVD
jgi:hypothetical protein